VNISTHSWMHTLVSLPAPASSSEPVLTIDKRLDALAEQFDAFANETHIRMARLEELLLAAKDWNMFRGAQGPAPSLSPPALRPNHMYAEVRGLIPSPSASPSAFSPLASFAQRPGGAHGRFSPPALSAPFLPAPGAVPPMQGPFSSDAAVFDPRGTFSAQGPARGSGVLMVSPEVFPEAMHLGGQGLDPAQTGPTMGVAYPGAPQGGMGGMSEYSVPWGDTYSPPGPQSSNARAGFHSQNWQAWR
jgi:hypothetical protein